MKKLTLAVLAHVDAGKTTLCEEILYEAGAIRSRGRVDAGSTALDTAAQERRRGITIFAGEASVSWNDAELNLLDTPGHVDFSAEAERMLAAADAALLVISGSDGVEAHTRTLWRLLESYALPVFLFVSKMDMGRRSEEEILTELQRELSPECLSVCAESPAERDEAIALLDEKLLEYYLSEGTLPEGSLNGLIHRRRLFPVYFGSGLTGGGVSGLLDSLSAYAPEWDAGGAFGARVYKISRDEKGSRLTHIKLTGGGVRVRDQLGEEKIARLCRFTGGRLLQTEQLTAGSTGILYGLEDTAAGQGLGSLSGLMKPCLEPVMRYALHLPEGEDLRVWYPRLKQLAEEDPALQLKPEEAAGELTVHLMGEIQAEILIELIRERFGLSVRLDAGRVLYRETITEPVEGVGHYEPLRHYAEVHLLMEPLPPGSGLVFSSRVSTDELDRNWQRLILTHLAEKVHLGTLTGGPITDMKLTLVAGKAHLKHTEGGDFRQATYRAVRQGLMRARESAAVKLLEPYYAYRLEVPNALIGRAMSDIRLRFGTVEGPETDGGRSSISGLLPVTTGMHYARELAAYSGGEGRISLNVAGYGPCHDTEAVTAACAYRPEADRENSPDSIFCMHGAGVEISWDKVPDYMHLPAYKPLQTAAAVPQKKMSVQSPRQTDDAALEALMEREFGPIRRPKYTVSLREYTREVPAPQKNEALAETYLIDGYNLIFAWEELKAAARDSLELARERLLSLLENFAGYSGRRVILIFDGYRVAGNEGERFTRGGVRVAFTKERETADMLIEAFLQELGKDERVAVVTNDNLIRLSAVRKGVLRMASESFREELTHTLSAMKEKLSEGDKRLGAAPDTAGLTPLAEESEE